MLWQHGEEVGLLAGSGPIYRPSHVSLQEMLGCWTSSARLHGAWAGGKMRLMQCLQMVREALPYMQQSANPSRSPTTSP